MLTMWVTEDEHRRLLERCDGKQLAAWMRQTCLDEKPARAGRLPSISPALLRQLAGMGNNLNQSKKTKICIVCSEEEVTDKRMNAM